MYRLLEESVLDVSTIALEEAVLEMRRSNSLLGSEEINTSSSQQISWMRSQSKKGSGIKVKYNDINASRAIACLRVIFLMSENVRFTEMSRAGSPLADDDHEARPGCFV